MIVYYASQIDGLDESDRLTRQQDIAHGLAHLVNKLPYGVSVFCPALAWRSPGWSGNPEPGHCVKVAGINGAALDGAEVLIVDLHTPARTVGVITEIALFRRRLPEAPIVIWDPHKSLSRSLVAGSWGAVWIKHQADFTSTILRVIQERVARASYKEAQ